MANQEWKKNLGFLESIMFDPVTSGILGLGEGIMSLFGVSEKNSQIDSLKNDYEKMKYSEDAMARRENRVKQVFGNLSNSMIGASQYLNGDTMRAMQNSKLATESAKGMLEQRMKDEQVNLGITDKINQLEGQKSGYVPAVANTIAQTAQGIFGAVQASMGMDQKELENDIIKNMFNPPTGTPTGVTNPVTGQDVVIPKKAEINPIQQDTPQKNVWDILGIENKNLGINKNVGTSSEIEEGLLNFGKTKPKSFDYLNLEPKIANSNNQRFDLLDIESLFSDLLPKGNVRPIKKKSLIGGII